MRFLIALALTACVSLGQTYYGTNPIGWNVATQVYEHSDTYVMVTEIPRGYVEVTVTLWVDGWPIQCERVTAWDVAHHIGAVMTLPDGTAGYSWLIVVSRPDVSGDDACGGTVIGGAMGDE